VLVYDDTLFATRVAGTSNQFRASGNSHYA
jgi:hypothetical protein